MNKIYYLKTCDTCKKILKQINNLEQFELQDIKTDPLTASQLAEMYQHTNSYEALFNNRARLYIQRNLKDQQITERVYNDLLLGHYSFLCRSVVFFKDGLFVGNAAKTIYNMLEKVNF